MRGLDSKLGRFAAALAGLFLAPGAAWAGAWTQPAGQGQATVSLYGWTGSASQYGEASPPRENQFGSQLYVEYGLADKVMVIGSVSIERYSILSPVNNTYVGPDYSQIGLQYRFAKVDDWVFSGSTSFFIPGARDASQPAQSGNTGGAAEARLLGGRSFKVSGMDGFVDAEFAYRDRTAGPPSEWHGDFTVGLKPNESNQASALMNVARNLGGTIGISSVQTLLAQRSQFHQAHMAEQLNPLNPNYVAGVARIAQVLTARGQPQAQASQEAVGVLYRAVGQQSQMLSYVDIFHILMIVVFAAIPLLLLMRGKPAGEQAAGGAA